MSKILSFWVLVGPLWEPLAPIFCVWVPLGDPVGSLGIFLDPLGDLLEALWDSVASLWEFPWNHWGLPGLPQRGRSPLGQTRLWITCDSLGVLGDSLGTLCGDPGGHTDRQTHRHTHRTRLEARPDKRPDQTRGQTRGYTRDLTDRQIRDQSRAEKPLQSRAVPKCFPFRC